MAGFIRFGGMCESDVTGTNTACRVLVVENHPDTRTYLTMCLEESGYHVTPVAGVEEALKALKKGSFDVILSDLGLNDGDGWQLMELAGDSRPPFAIAMSGFGTLQDLQRSAAAGYHHHLVKPFTAAELRNLLKEGEVLQREALRKKRKLH